MNEQMLVQVALLRKRARAHAAAEGFLSGVAAQVCRHVVLEGEGLATQRALVWTLPCVNAFVRHDVALVLAPVLAVAALEARPLGLAGLFPTSGRGDQS